MSHFKVAGLPLVLLCAFTASASGHYGILLPQSWSVQRDHEVTVTFQWGHPFEHELSDAARPTKAELLLPDGSRQDMTKNLAKTTTPAASKKTVTAYTIRFTPSQRGDHVVVLTGA